ncbi:MAG: FAD-dependent oxidoreductase [Bacillaceae bacterium]|nr:FAD-dependent oxidoreductase [Bacillaceae bacterium]
MPNEKSNLSLEDKEDISVTVVGAGISGLRAAQLLQQEGINVKVLEASDYIGGRLKTNRSFSFPFDEGGSWIHTPIGNPLTEIATKSKTKTIITEENNIILYNEHGKRISHNLYLKEKKRFMTALNSLSRYGELGKSFAEINNKYFSRDYDLLQRFILSTYLSLNIADIHHLSSKYYDIGKVFQGSDTFLISGFDSLINYLATDLDVIINTRVLEIDYTDSKVHIKTSTTEYISDYVIVTVPLGVLKKGLIRFNPELPKEKQEAINKIGFFHVNKVFLQWETSFWDEEQFIGMTSHSVQKFNYFVNVNKMDPTQNVLITFAYGDEARKMEEKKDEVIIEEVMQILKVMYGNSIPYPTSILRSNWINNENTYGSYSFPTVDTIPLHFDHMAETIENKVFFAGEHTIKDYFSYAHGAYLSGHREADKIIQHYKKRR